MEKHQNNKFRHLKNYEVFFDVEKEWEALIFETGKEREKNFILGVATNLYRLELTLSLLLLLSPIRASGFNFARSSGHFSSKFNKP